MAKAAGSETRAALFDVSLQLAWHINQYHAFSAPNATWKITAESEFTKYTKGFQLPKLGEGISEVRRQHNNSWHDIDCLPWLLRSFMLPQTSSLSPSRSCGAGACGTYLSRGRSDRGHYSILHFFSSAVSTTILLPRPVRLGV